MFIRLHQASQQIKELKCQVTFDVTDQNLRTTFLADTVQKAIETLEKETQPKWGKMTAQHMVEHLIFTFQISSGKLDVECRTPDGKLGRMQFF